MTAYRNVRSEPGFLVGMAEGEPVRSADGTGKQAQVRGERRWPMAVAVIVAIVVLVLLPNGTRPGPRRALALGVLITALIVATRVASTAGRLLRLLSTFP